MKRYKLKKDTLTVKAGAIFEEEDDPYDDKRLVQVVPDEGLISTWVVVRDINNFDEWFEKIPEFDRWRAERGEEYWHIDGFGKVDYGYEGEKSGDIHSDFAHFDYATGNYFKTKEEAKAYLKYLLARQILIDDAKGGGFINGEKNYYANYCTPSYYNGMNWYINFDFNTYTPGVIYFRDKDILQESLKKHKDQWDIVRKYEKLESR